MAVHAFKHDPLSVQRHNMVFHLKSAESGLLGYDFTQAAVRIIYLNCQIIQFRFFRTPELWSVNLPQPCILSCQLFLILQTHHALIGKADAGFSRSPCLCPDLEFPF